MSEFQKLRVETTGLHSVFTESSTVDITNLDRNTMLKRIEDSCEELKEAQQEIREDTEKNQTAILNKLTSIFDDKKKEESLVELKTIRQAMKSQQEEVLGAFSQYHDLRDSTQSAILIKIAELADRITLEETLKQVKSIGKSLENVQKTQKAQDEMIQTLLRHAFGNSIAPQVLQPTINKKQFVLKHTFENIDLVKSSYGSDERHFGYEWYSVRFKKL